MNDKKYQAQLALVEAAKAKKRAFVLNCKYVLTEQHFVDTEGLFMDSWLFWAFRTFIWIFTNHCRLRTYFNYTKKQ